MEEMEGTERGVEVEDGACEEFVWYGEDGVEHEFVDCPVGYHRTCLDVVQQFPSLSVRSFSFFIRPPSLTIPGCPSSLASRGAKFDNATYYTTYRNVSSSSTHHSQSQFHLFC